MDIRTGSMTLVDSKNLPKAPTIGQMYFDIRANQVLLWTGKGWTPIDNAAPDEDVLKEWEVVIANVGWCGIRIFFDHVKEQLRITISDEQGVIIKQGLENVLEYIKNNIKSEEDYLHSEARIFEFFS
jgi:hypothetical protein